MASPQQNIDKLNAWYECLLESDIATYINFRTGELTKSKVARDAGFDRKALSDKLNGNPALQARFQEIQEELHSKGFIDNPGVENKTGTPNNPQTINTASKELKLAQKRIIELEKKLAEADVRLLKQESQNSNLSELREVMVDLGVITK